MSEKLDINEIVEEHTKDSIEEQLIKRVPIDSESKYKPEYTDVASRLISAGFTQEDLGYVFQVHVRTIRNWMKRHPEFKMAIKEGKTNQQKRLVAKSLQTAAGYDYVESNRKITRDASGAIIKDVESVFNKHSPPNHNLLIWLLCNISRQLGDDDWMSKHTLEVDQKKVVIHIDGTEEFKRITDFAGKYLDGNTKVIKSKVVNETKPD